MRRRTFLKSGIASATLLAGSGELRAQEAPLKPPNILWLSAEDLSPDLGCYGDTYATTPNLDAFAQRAIRYDRAYSHAGVCAPSRSGLITGMYPTTIGTQHMRCSGIPPAGVKCFPEYLRAAGYYCTNNSKTDYQFEPPLSAWDENSKKAHWKNRPEGAPFFSVFNFVTTHEGQVRSRDPERLAQIELLGDLRHDPAGVALPPYHADTPATRKDWAQYYDLITLMDREVGEALAELEEAAPSTTNLAHYADVVRERALLRALIVEARRLEGLALTVPLDVQTLIDDAQRCMLMLGQAGGRNSWADMSEVMDAEIVRIEQLGHKASDVTGTSTGFRTLDRHLSGFHPSDLIILAARPAMGKTALALNFAQNVALESQRAVGIFSMEMSRGQLVTRMLCCESLVDATRVRNGKLDTDEWGRLEDASSHLRNARVFIDDTPGLSIVDVRARAKKLKAQHPDLALIVIDYLQLMKGEDPRSPREQQIASISRGLKGLGKDLDLTVIALSQLNRGVESRADKRPMSSDLRESGAIEQDADIILFMYRDEYYNKDSPDKGLAEVIIAKHRNGDTGTVKLTWQGHFARFDDYAADSLLRD